MKQDLVLVIENRAERRRLLVKSVLEPNAYRHMTAVGGEEGLKIALEERPTLIILALQLPQMNGFEVLEELRERDVDIPVILTSTQQSEEYVLRALRLGACDYLVEPFDPQEMLAAIQRACASVRSREEQRQLTQRLREANRQLERQLQELNTLYTIGRSVTSLLDLTSVLNRVVEAAVYMAGAEEGTLMLLDDESEELYLRAAKDVGEKVARNLRLKVDDSVAGRSLRTERPVHLAGDRAKVATGYLVKSLLYIPLRVPGRGGVGVLGVANRQSPKTFSKRDIFLLSALADYAAIAIENARLFKDVEAERTKLEAVLREADEAIIVVDEGNDVLLCNSAARAALDLAEVDLTCRPVDEVLSHPAMREMFAYGREAGSTVRREISLHDGRTFNAQLTSIEGVGRVLMMQDITHLKELDRIKSEFVATVSHDLRTPLTSIQGYVALLPKVGPLNEKQQDFIDRVQTSMTSITELIGDLLDIGRIEAGLDLEMSACDFLEILDEVVRDLQPQAAGKRQELRWEPPDALPLIQGNARRLRQVMDNLVSNAIKYTQEEGWISVSAAEDDGYIVVNVADNGIGIPLKQQPFIFDKFYRVESDDTIEIEGTGLGLAIVKTVIEKHNGRVWVESRPGVGSVFSFVLPTLED